MDWLASGLSLIGMYLLPRDRTLAIYICIISSCFFLVWSVQIRSVAIALLQVVMIIINLRTLLIWRTENGNKRNKP